MKLGPFDGTTEEYRDLTENHGFRIEDFIEKPPIPLKPKFIFLSSLCLMVTIICLLIIPSNLHYHKNIVIILGMAFGTWLTVNVQLKFDKMGATLVTAIGIILMILFAAKYITLKEVADFIKNIK